MSTHPLDRPLVDLLDIWVSDKVSPSLLGRHCLADFLLMDVPANYLGLAMDQINRAVIDAEQLLVRAQSGDRAAIEGLYLALVGELLIARQGVEDYTIKDLGIRDQRRRGGQARAAKLKAEDKTAWMRPIFAAAWAKLDADCQKRIGHNRLLLTARRLVGPGHPDHYRRDEINEWQARAYLKSRL